MGQSLDTFSKLLTSLSPLLMDLTISKPFIIAYIVTHQFCDSLHVQCMMSLLFFFILFIFSCSSSSAIPFTLSSRLCNLLKMLSFKLLHSVTVSKLHHQTRPEKDLTNLNFFFHKFPQTVQCAILVSLKLFGCAILVSLKLFSVLSLLVSNCSVCYPC